MNLKTGKPGKEIEFAWLKAVIAFLNSDGGTLLIGAEFSDFSSFTLVEIDQKKVIIVVCQPAGKPVFLRVGKNEEFYIRSGPSNSKLTPSRMIRYIQQKK